MRNLLIVLVVAVLCLLVGWLAFTKERPAGSPEVVTKPAVVEPAPVPETAPTLAGAPERERATAPVVPLSDAPKPAPVVSARPRSIVFGRVVDDEGHPVEGVRLSLSAVGTQWAEGETIPHRKVGRFDVEGFDATSAADGRFRFDVPLPESDWISLHTDAPPHFGIAGCDFGSAGGRNKPRLKEGDNDLGDLVIAITGAVSGEVHAADGGAVGGAEVRLEGSFPGGFSVQTVCDEAGRFVLGHVPEGMVTVGAKAEGYLSASQSGVEVKKRATTPGVVFRLERAPVISGRVVDESGAPIEKVRMWGWPVSAGQGAGARSKTDGTFTIYLPQNEPYKLEVQGEEFEPWGGFQSDKTFDPGTTDVLVSLKRTKRTTFVVVDGASGAPIERYGLSVRDKPQKEGSYGGAFHVSEVGAHPQGEVKTIGDPERHVVCVVAPGFEDFEADVRHDDASGARQTLRLKRGGTIVLRVMHAGQPVDGASVKLERDAIKIDPSKPDDEDDFFNSNYTYDLSDFLGRARMCDGAPDGSVRIADLSPGTYRLTVSGGKGAPKMLKDVRLEPGGTRDLGTVELDASATVNGRVVLGPGQSTADVEVYLDDDWIARRTLVNATGAFTFENVAAGKHVMNVRVGVIGLQEQVEFEAVAGATKEVVVDLSTKAPCKVRVHVTRGGRPVPDVEVAFEHTDGDRFAGQQPVATTGADGTATGSCPGGSRGEFIVRGDNQLVLGRGGKVVELVAGAMHEAEIAIQSGELVIQFPPTLVVPDPGSFMVSLQGGEGAAKTYQFLHCSSAHAPFRMSKLVWKEPRCPLGPVAPGEYTISVQLQFLPDPAQPDAQPAAPPVKPFQGKITIEADKTTVVEIPQ